MSATRTEHDLEALLLSVESRDTESGVELTLWGSSPTHGPVRATVTGQQAVMFVPRAEKTRDGRRELRPLRTLQNVEVDAVYFTSQRAMLRERDRLRADGGVVLESDVKPTHRFLMERFINGSFTSAARRALSTACSAS